MKTVIAISVTAAMVLSGCFGIGGGLNGINNPSADASFTPTSPVAGQQVSINASSNDAGGDSNAKYNWSFGDGSAPSTSGPNQAHVYALPGTYIVTLNVTNANGHATNDNNLLFIDVSPVAPNITATTKFTDLDPVATMTVSPPVISPGGSVTVNASGSYGWDNNACSDAKMCTFDPKQPVSPGNLPVAPDTTSLSMLSWNWGDGSAATTGNLTSALSAKHTYAKAGLYLITLNVTTSGGRSGKSAASVYVLASPPSTIHASNKDVFVTATISGPQSFDPGFDYETAGGTVIEATYDRLYGYNHGDTSHPVGEIAAALPVTSADGKHVNITIRQGLKFQDGTTLDAAAVKFSLDRLILMNDPASAASAVLAPIVNGATAYEATTGTAADRQAYLAANGIVAVGSYQIQINMPRPDPDVAARLAFASCAIVSPTAVKAPHNERVPIWGVASTPDGLPPATANGKVITRDPWMDTHTAGSGPFTLRTWIPGDRVILDAWQDYTPTPVTQKAVVKTVIIRYVDDLNTRVLMLQTGQADDIYVPVSQINTVSPEITNVADVTFQNTLTTGLGFFNYHQASDANHPCPTVDGVAKCDFFANENVRKAIDLSFDYNSFINNVGHGHLSQLVGVIPTGLPGAASNGTPAPYKQDLTSAKAAWSAAGLSGHKVVFTVYYNSGNLVRQGAATILQTNVQSLDPGVTVNVVPEPFASILDDSQKQLLSMWFLGWAPDYVGTFDYIAPFLLAGGNYPVDQAFNNATFNAAINNTINNVSAANQPTAWWSINKMAVDHYVDLFLYQGQQAHVQAKYVQGYYFSPTQSGQPDVGDYTQISKT